MSNLFVALKCTLSWHHTPQSIKLDGDGTWHRVSNVWIPYERGTWTQDSNQGVMVAGNDNTRVLFLQGFIFASATEHQHGGLLWELDGGGGTWSVVSVIGQSQ
ncbi:hypothetical protein BurMR1_1902 [Burkholderia sp. MR1]|nr:hypothetical protein BurMR1_1902 [Burkholderia sp. MR1]